MTESILSYNQSDSIKLLCEIDLNKLLPGQRERERFNKKWEAFKESDSCNKEIFELKGDLLKYQSEQIIPSKSDNRPPLLLILGNPASHSVKEGMFFSFEGDKKEHRFWKIIRDSEVLDLPIEPHLSVKEQNNRRKQYLLELKYETPFRVGLCVFISIPSSSSKDYSGVAGIQKLIGANALNRLEKEESLRVIECAKKFLYPKGIAVTFQKNAWNGLKSDKDLSYSKDNARNGNLKGTLKDTPNIPLLGVPPTRLFGPCSEILRRLLEEKGYSLLKKKIMIGVKP
jgi:hypothetical protein